MTTAGMHLGPRHTAPVRVSDDWREQGICREVDPYLWHGDTQKDVAEAKAICHRCPVEAECREYALANHEQHGTWGGLSTKDRQRIWRQRRAAA